MVKPGERLRPDVLTVNERVLLHLKEGGTSRDALDAFPLTQPGISEALGIRVNHVSRAVKQLMRQGLIEEGVARVRGEVRKRKVYGITGEGRTVAQHLATDVGQRNVLVADASGERSVTVSEARRQLTPSTITHLLSLVNGEGRLDLTRASVAPAREVAAFDEGRPPPAPIVGRGMESEIVRGWLGGSPPLLAVVGPRGIGKTALVASLVPTDRPRFWWSFRGADRISGFLGGLGAWLAELGKGDLRMRLGRDPPNWREVGKILLRDLKGTRALVVLDDLDAVSPELAPYVDALVEAGVTAGCHVAVTTESPPPRRAEWKSQGWMKELRLRGLDRAAARSMMPPSMSDAEFGKILRLTDGNPMSLRLLAAEEAPAAYTPEERALLKVLRMRQDET